MAVMVVMMVAMLVLLPGHMDLTGGHHNTHEQEGTRPVEQRAPQPQAADQQIRYEKRGDDR